MYDFTEDEMKEVRWVDFSILKDKDNNCVLILIAEDEPHKNVLHNFITYTKVGIVSYTNEDKTISFGLIYKDKILKYDTDLEVDGYPPLQWLLNGEVEFITSGVWMVDNSLVDYYRQFVRLGSFSSQN